MEGHIYHRSSVWKYPAKQTNSSFKEGGGGEGGVGRGGGREEEEEEEEAEEEEEEEEAEEEEEEEEESRVHQFSTVAPNDGVHIAHTHKNNNSASLLSL